MPGLVPGIHVVLGALNDVDGRDKPGHDDVETDERANSILIGVPLSHRGAGTAPRSRR
ncbi:hypothetical protein BRAS3809_6900001 [Bradyrhizobium sp. STM 3809]|nr:hypothetical protein BRAS3809_6900001 [Bradyrhizobium sp. STM 3809]